MTHSYRCCYWNGVGGGVGGEWRRSHDCHVPGWASRSVSAVACDRLQCGAVVVAC